MKKLVCLVLTALTLLPLVGCGGKKAPYMIMVNTVNGVAVYDAMAAAAKEAAEDYGVRLEVTGPTADQIEEIDAVIIQAMEDAVAKKPDAIICEPMTDASKDVIEKAREAGIAVFCISSPAREGDYIAVIGTDNAAYGVRAADLLAEKTSGKGQVLAVISRADIVNQQEQLKAFTDRLADKYPDMAVSAVVEDHTSTEMAEEAVREALTDHPEIDSVLMLEAVAGPTAAKVGKESGRDLLILGIDADKVTLDAVRSGDIFATLVQNHEKRGYEVIRMAYEHLAGERTFEPGTFVDSSILLITDAEVDQVDEIMQNAICRKGSPWQ